MSEEQSKKSQFVKDHLMVFAILLLLVIGIFNMFSDASILQKFSEKSTEEGAEKKGLFSKITAKVVDETPQQVPTETTKKEPVVLTKGEWVEGIVYFVILIGVIAGLFTYSTVSLRIQEQVDSRQVILNYIALARAKGFSDKHIKKRLQDHGWNDQQADQAMIDSKNDLKVSIKVK